MPDTLSFYRPKTTKLYLHPPLAERFITLWPDFKVVNGEITDRPVKAYQAFGFLLLTGQSFNHLDWLRTRFSTRPDGLPIYYLTYDAGDYTLSLEVFCSHERTPVTYCRITVANTSAWPVSETITFLPRSGDERYLTEYNWDGYGTYAPGGNTWRMLPSNWDFDGQAGLHDQERHILVHHSKRIPLRWVEKAHAFPLNLERALTADISLGVGEEISFDLALRNESVADFDYDLARQACIAVWEGILNGIQQYLNTSQPVYRTIFQSLVVQCLQMLACPVGESYVIPRQGGINRGVWPWEACDFLIPLDRIGLHHYTALAFDYFVNQMQVKEGANKGKIGKAAFDWGCLTGVTVGGWAEHARLTGDPQVFARYRSAMLAGLAWMEGQRARTQDSSFTGLGRGLFPPMRAHDWEGDIQSWTSTDANNLIGLERMARAFRHFNDPEADRIEGIYQDYRSIMQHVLAEVTRGTEDAEEVMIPHMLDHPVTDPPVWPVFVDAANLLRSGLVPPGSRLARQVEAWFRNRNLMRGSFTGLMPCSLIEFIPVEHTSGHEWYMLTSDAFWFHAWLAGGELEKAAGVFYNVLKYAMTPEFYVMERYADNDPAFTPWQPNASANGRLIEMMLAFFEEVV
jgi:hypothetical protein